MLESVYKGSRDGTKRLDNFFFVNKGEVSCHLSLKSIIVLVDYLNRFYCTVSKIG